MPLHLLGHVLLVKATILTNRASTESSPSSRQREVFVTVWIYCVDHNIQVVDSFVYLGSCITKDNDEYVEIQRRLKLANKAYFSLLAVMRCKDIHNKTKVMLYKT
jgi:hypothetical protein